MSFSFQVTQKEPQISSDRTAPGALGAASNSSFRKFKAHPYTVVTDGLGCASCLPDEGDEIRLFICGCHAA
ncbi:hypothetical protein [Paenibacillus pedocola]|uniref:hypothetical protein n=1 Tax=Paenibacillus pedocola TaxID=3242193 RepID=UPI002877D32D|nr:hypothetical protein [Paenibacillus typhae]